MLSGGLKFRLCEPGTHANLAIGWDYVILLLHPCVSKIESFADGAHEPHAGRDVDKGNATVEEPAAYLAAGRHVVVFVLLAGPCRAADLTDCARSRPGVSDPLGPSLRPC